MHGFLNIHKPLGITSHDAVAQVRRVLRAGGRKDIKVGHAGTLDPLAEGVLILCLGFATRLSEYVMASTKTYQAEITFGATTTTDDAEGETLTIAEASHLTEADIAQALTGFIGTIEQIPPMYSAIKQDGRKLYDLARAGQVVDRPPRTVTIEACRLVAWRSPVASVEVVCGAGTYIRSLARDAGEAVGTGAYLSGLVRVASGSFTLDKAVMLDDLRTLGNVADRLIGPRLALGHWVQIDVDAEQSLALRQGRPIALPPAGQASLDGLLLAVEGETLVALVRADEDKGWPHKVFSASGGLT